MIKFTFVVFTAFLAGALGVEDNFLPCDSDIYCYGDIIHLIQESEIFPDSKTFVDMPLKYEPNVVKTNFEFMINQYGKQPPEGEIKKFLEHNFHEAGYEFVDWVPPDWKQSPSFLSKVKNTNLRKFGSELNGIWKKLGRGIREDVRIRNNMYSMIYVNHSVVVPGGRFREFYYWDQFWILKGLLHCEMTDSVKGMLLNFMQMVEEIGYIPNGGRIYYKRSHPPLLIPMVEDYLNHVNDPEFLAQHINTLQKEFDFWLNNRAYDLTINGTTYTVFRYNVELGNPRPESYHPDYELVSKIPDPEKQTRLYAALKTAAESGIDFSYRWYLPDDPSERGFLEDTRANDIIPIDLNVLILRNALILTKFHEKLRNTRQMSKYATYAAAMEETINAVFWNETHGSWFDYVIAPNRTGHKTEFFPGNILPLILGLPSMTSKTPKVLKYLQDEVKVFAYPGGIPSSLENTDQQWDYPNAWAPHNHWFIESLEATGDAKAKTLAQQTAQKWVYNCYLTYRTHQNVMFEKYDAETPGNRGGGGEYDVVEGFGWSNGVVLDLLNKYGSSLTVPGTDGNGALTSFISLPALLLGLLTYYLHV